MGRDPQSHHRVAFRQFASGNLTRQHIAPFRDNNQTSMYVGTLVATGRMDENAATDFLFWQPRIFEISRHGALGFESPVVSGGRKPC